MELGLASAIAALEERTGYRVDDEQVIPAEMGFRAWCETLSKRRKCKKTGKWLPGLMVDGHPFTLETRPAMAWIYDQVPTTRADAFRKVLVLMKCAQVGFTVMEMLAAIYMGVKFAPCTVGMFLPDQALAQIKSTERFMPIVRTVPEVHQLMTQDASDGSGAKGGEGNVRTRRINGSLYAFAWTSGRATTESIPMDVLSFDEVQEMSLAQMEKTAERLGASAIKFQLMGSTANWPDADIHFHYKKGKQYRFHTRCPTCGAMKPLDEYFPECIGWDPDEPDELTRRPGTYRYRCEEGHWIDDSQDGEWIAENPEEWIDSIHFHQMLSPTVSPAEIMQKFLTSTDKKNFYNRVLGKPYLDPTQIPVTLEHMRRCVEAGKAANPPAVWKARSRGAFMGIDQMGGYNVYVVKERRADGRQQVIHAEEHWSEDPFARADELMEAYGIAVAVVEINPNYNDAKRFANRHKGKVFICNSFGSLPDDMVKWKDTPKLDISDRRTDDEERDEYTVQIDQYKCMSTSMARFTAKDPVCLWPDDQALTQDVFVKGVRMHEAIAPRAFHHFTKTALVAEKDEETNAYKRVVKKVGIDPHFSYANLLCDVAYARAHGTTIFILADATPDKEAHRATAIEMAAPGLPTHVVASMAAAPQGFVCGRCQEFPVDGEFNPLPQGPCALRGFITQAVDPGCDFFASAS